MRRAFPPELGYRFGLRFLLRGAPYWPRLWAEDRRLNSFSTRERVLALQRDRLESLLRHAYRTVPYYKEALRALAEKYPGFKRCPLDAIPPLYKREIVAGRARFVSTRRNRVTEHFSSGTTGEPLSVYRELYGLYYQQQILGRHMGRLAAQLELALKPFQSTFAYLWLVGQDTAGNPTYLKPRIWTYLPYFRFLRHFYLFFGDDEALMKKAEEAALKVRPEILAGEPTILGLFALLLKRRGHETCPFPVRVLLTTGSQLFPEQRAELERFYGARVINHYSLGEVGSIGMETPGRGFTCYDAAFIIEILDEKLRPVPPGTTGLIALTSLLNRTMPLLRYIPGDVGRLAPDGDGVFSRLESVDGRVNDIFPLKDGKFVHSYDVAATMTAFPLARFQIVQETLDRLVLRTEVPVEGALQAKITATLSKLLCDPGLQVAFEVQTFDLTRKFQAIVSNVPHRYKDLLGGAKGARG